MTNARRFRDGNGRYAPGTQTWAETTSKWISEMATWTEEELLVVGKKGKNTEPAAKRAAALRVLSARGL